MVIITAILVLIVVITINDDGDRNIEYECEEMKNEMIDQYSEQCCC